MITYTVTGLVDEDDLYVAAVQPGHHVSEETSQETVLRGYGTLTRFLGYFEADSADEAERIAVDVVRHYTDDDAPLWAPAEGLHFRKVETVETDKI